VARCRAATSERILLSRGLALTIGHWLVKALGDSIAVENQPGDGSAFTVCVPSACVVETPIGVALTEGK
jgi:signal transduction histidine kinase